MFVSSPNAGRRHRRRSICALMVALAALLAFAGPVSAQEQDDESKALDSTATQWSFQFAYQWMPDYYDDVLDNGLPRPAGLDNYLQLRIVAPLVFQKFTILPRLTVRHYENVNTGDSGFGNTELFGVVFGFTVLRGGVPFGFRRGVLRFLAFFGALRF